MELLRDTMLILHFIGLASLLGGFLVQMKPPTKVINMAMVHGVLTQLITGLALVGIAEAGDAEVDHARVAVKLGVTLVVTVLVFLHRKKKTVAVPVWGIIGLLTIANIVVAVMWR